MPPALDRAFELLFKYRPAVFERGQLALEVPRPVAAALIAAALVAAAGIVVSYRRLRTAPVASGVAERAREPRARALLTALRLGALAVLVACLLRPVLVVSASAPGRNTIAVLVDDSRSMRVADVEGRPRADFVASTFARGAPLLSTLSDEFAVRVYRFSDVAQRVPDASALAFAGDRTRIGAALERVRTDLSALPLAGIVLVTDGADGDPAALGEAALALRARGAPLFTVGVGREAAERDLELARAEAPRSVLRGSTIAVDAVVSHAGFAGATVPVVVERDGRIVARREVKLPAGGESVPVRLDVPASEEGAQRLKVRVVPRDGESLAQNNERETVVRVADGREKILYFEGEPRFELKFVRRAVAGDENLRLVALQRTAENKYLRLGVADSLDLVSGFPSTREELFSYHAVVLGSVEASAFTPAQLRMLADFVSERGGGLLVLGGRRSLAEGGYAGTALADVLPVVLEPQTGDANRDDAPPVELTVRPTAAGLAHAPLQIAADERASAERWRTLPPLTTVNLVRRAKPGAAVLLAGEAPGGGTRIVLAHQRFGRGRSVAFAVQDSWLWQMHAGVVVDDMAHELFWRQLLRWLASSAPGPVTLESSSERPAPGEAVTLRAEVRDSAFAPVNGARVVARVTTPSGARVEVPLDWSVERDGEYRGSFTPSERGVHEVEVEAQEGTRALGSAEMAYVDVVEPRDEYFGSAMHGALLRRLAAESGGRFYTPATVGGLPEDLRYTRSGITVVERKELWDMPVLFVLLALLLAGEWGYRRARGLA